MFTLRAPAKINLALEVLGKRTDGYHDIISVVQEIDLCDDLIFEPADVLELSCENLWLPDNENLVLKAAQLLRRESGTSQGAKIKLVKQIPSGAGLGGGSSDAAATLWALNQLWGVRWTTSRLAILAAQLGSDVPYFLHGGSALVEGRGDRVTALPQVPPRWVVLLAPPSDLPGKTATLYRALTVDDFSDGTRTRQLVEQLKGGVEPRDLSLINAFDRPARQFFPHLEEYRRRLLAAGAARTFLSGSGPTLYCIERSVDDAARVAARLSASEAPVFVARTSSGCLFAGEARDGDSDVSYGSDVPSS